MGSEHSTNNRQEEANKQADWENGTDWESPAQDSSPPENREGCAAQGQGFAVGPDWNMWRSHSTVKVSQVLHRISCMAGKGS